MNKGVDFHCILKFLSKLHNNGLVKLKILNKNPQPPTLSCGSLPHVKAPAKE